ncbi:hypothetical protein KIPB_000096 [Kipferlia bialata]|uniref:Uncharacterized protein n=1 Tax=Kipferlia bialata TaxID=797122 RepID=A0A9K3CM08_9EUKA|nr:hypothetical protein KIPB_000096 [Kipferlia bialata]|eukprot:g96.t1
MRARVISDSEESSDSGVPPPVFSEEGGVVEDETVVEGDKLPSGPDEGVEGTPYDAVSQPEGVAVHVSAGEGLTYNGEEGVCSQSEHADVDPVSQEAEVSMCGEDTPVSTCDMTQDGVDGDVPACVPDGGAEAVSQEAEVSVCDGMPVSTGDMAQDEGGVEGEQSEGTDGVCPNSGSTTRVG